jgi:DNA-binding NarL/FixJ family response regulator
MFMDSLERVLSDEPDIEVVGKANACVAAFEMAESLRPDVAIVEYRLRDGDGVVTAAALRTVSPGTQVVLLAELADSRFVAAAIEAGCSGFLTKDREACEVVVAVRVAHAGEVHLSPDVVAALLPHLDGDRGGLGSDLTDREHEMLTLMTSGLGNKDIAGQLHLSIHTIRNHVQNLLVKLGAHTKLEAVAIASREGLVEGGARHEM